MCFSSRSKQWKESCHIFPCTGPRKIEWQARSTRASPCPQGTKREEAGRESGKCSGFRIIHSQIYKHGRLWDQVLHTKPYSHHFPYPHLPHENPHSHFTSWEYNLRTSAHLTLLDQLFQTTETSVDGLKLEESLPRN